MEERSVLADKIYRALCFDYMHNGSLQRHLDGKMMVLYLIHWQGCLSLNLSISLLFASIDEVNRLDWPTCYKIIKGTCEGLKYLHEGTKTPM
jgi:hypothetical protein